MYNFILNNTTRVQQKFWSNVKRNKSIYKLYYSCFQKVEAMEDVNADLKEEVLITMDILKRMDPPDAPTVTGNLTLFDCSS